MARSVAANGRDAENGTGFGTETLDGSAPAGAASGVAVSWTGLATMSMGRQRVLHGGRVPSSLHAFQVLREGGVVIALASY